MKKEDNLEKLKVDDWVRIYKREDYRKGLYTPEQEYYKVGIISALNEKNVKTDVLAEFGGKWFVWKRDENHANKEFNIPKIQLKNGGSINREYIIFKLSPKERKELVLKGLEK